MFNDSFSVSKDYPLLHICKFLRLIVKQALTININHLSFFLKLTITKGIQGGVVKVVDFKALAPHWCWFKS
jgi:hypothetical protein